MGDNCILIMAGGKGTRFWPKSTEDKPKQFLNIIGDKTMLQQTFERVSDKYEASHIFVVTCEKYKSIVLEQLPDLYKDNIIIEPSAKSTSACILLSSLYINQIFPNANIIELPSDHLIKNTKGFLKAINIATEFINKKQDCIITLGIKPNRPETGYGYIRVHNNQFVNNKTDIISVERFIEKPNLIKAKEYIQDGKYFWNSGIFIFNVSYILKMIKENLPNTYNALKNIPIYTDMHYMDILKDKYNQCEEMPIEYSVMEKCNSMYVIPSNFEWDDIGTWSSIQRYIKPDQFSNIIKGNVETINSHNNIVHADDKNIVLLGVNDIFVIDSKDTIIVGRKDELSKVHELKSIIEKRKI